MSNKTKNIRAAKLAKRLKITGGRFARNVEDSKVHDFLTGSGTRKGKGEAIVWEGLRPQDFGIAADTLMTKQGSKVQPQKTRGMLISGKQMNRIYKLTGSNAYPNDLNILAVEQKWKRHPHSVGARWGNDVVDNNARRQKVE